MSNNSRTINIEVSPNKDSLTIEKSSLCGLCFEASNPRCDCAATLTAKSSADGRVIEHKLPFEVMGAPLNCLQYGRRLSFAKDTVLSVKLSKICQHHSSHNTEIFGQWRIVTQSWMDVSLDQNGDLSNHAKRLICSECRKTFATVDQMERHVKSNHKVIDMNSIWNKPLRILYEDEALAVIDKPQGIAVMGGEGLTLQRSDLLLQLGNSKAFKPVPVHRLDAMTGGLLLVAKSKTSESKLKTMFQDRNCKKRYRALVFGRLEEKGDSTIRLPISGKPTETRYQVVSHTRSADPLAAGWVTTVDLYPLTGRTHQLRKHLKHVGHSIWGDRRYGRYPKTTEKRDNDPDKLLSVSIEENPHARLCLYAMEITFPHPVTGKEMTVSIHEPTWLTCLVAREEKLSLDSEKNGR